MLCLKYPKLIAPTPSDGEIMRKENLSASTVAVILAADLQFEDSRRTIIRKPPKTVTSHPTTVATLVVPLSFPRAKQTQ
jgi:hypothetical protein